MTEEDLIELNFLFTDALVELNEYLEEKSTFYDHILTRKISQSDSTYKDKKFSLYLKVLQLQLEKQPMYGEYVEEEVETSVSYSYKRSLETLLLLNQNILDYSKNEIPGFEYFLELFFFRKQVIKRVLRVAEIATTKALNINKFMALVSPLSTLPEFSKLEKSTSSHFGNTKGIVMAPDFDHPLDDFEEYM